MNAELISTASEARPDALVPSILCVDDEPNILSALRRLFRTDGYRVHVAESGDAGLHILENEAVDIVISDMRMPAMDGARFLAQVRSRWPDTVRLLLTGHSDIEAVIGAVNRGEIYRYIAKPWDDQDMLLLVRQALERKLLGEEKRALELLTRKQNEALKALNAGLEDKVMERTAELAAANVSLLGLNEKLKGNLVTSLKVLSTLIEMRGDRLAGHARRVADLSRRIALKLGLQGEMVQEIFMAALLHEIGKLGFSDELLSLSVVSMTKEQLGEYRQHAGRGEQLLMPLQDLHGAAASIGAQLERFDGTGFPRQLGAESVPIGARVLAVASDYDNLQTGALVPRKLDAGEARAFVERGSGTRYDPAVVAAFLAVVGGGASAAPEPADGDEVLLASADIRPGMVLSRDLIAPSGLLMLPAGQAFDQGLILKIQAFEKSRDIQLVAYIRRPGAKAGRDV